MELRTRRRDRWNSIGVVVDIRNSIGGVIDMPGMVRKGFAADNVPYVPEVSCASEISSGRTVRLS
jgi:hypothetical protein